MLKLKYNIVKPGCLAICFLLALHATAQYTLSITVADSSKKKQLYVVGDFNNWNSGDANFALKPLDSIHHTIILSHLNKGAYRFKFTRGSWATVESTAEGIDINDRNIVLQRDTTINIKIAGWLDNYVDISKLPDSTKAHVLIARTDFFLEKNIDSSYKYAMAANALAKKIGTEHLIVSSIDLLGNVMERKGDNVKALELFFEELQQAALNNDTGHLILANYNLGILFKDQKDYEKAKYYFLNVIKIKPGNYFETQFTTDALTNMGQIFLSANMPDSALIFAEKAYNNTSKNTGNTAILLGDIQKKIGRDSLSYNYYREAIADGMNTGNLNNIADGYQRIAQYFNEHKQPDSGFYYSKKAFSIAEQINNPLTISNAGSLLVRFFQNKKQLDSAFIYQQKVLQANAVLFNQDKEKQIEKLVVNQALRDEQVKEKQAAFKARLKIYLLLGGVAVLLLLAAILYRSNKHKQKANVLLEQKREEIQKALQQLKAAQNQLIQSEKMASLGELTAGIAHEIQNPLNFVNNFSEVSNELIDEIQGERLKAKGERDEALEDDLLNDIKQNLEKINHHGKRADAIVKGMLQHSRAGGNTKELTDINKLADEYVRLAYHGFKAKDKSFNTQVTTLFDGKLPKINVVPQNAGRVLLNILTNAFYAVRQRQKTAPADYRPEVSITTLQADNFVVIKIKDNGTGIPAAIKEKIMQPFFTTKPAGEGTGLGLSLTYDIIVKGHEGIIEVNSVQGEFTEFVVRLPLAV